VGHISDTEFARNINLLESRTIRNAIYDPVLAIRLIACAKIIMVVGTSRHAIYEGKNIGNYF